MSKEKIDFKERAIAVHGNKYDYSQSVYSGMHKKLTIVCPIHGPFEQEAHSHLKGQGCPKCGIESRSRKRSDTKETFIEKARKVHGDKYDYSNVEYNGPFNNVRIICQKHGEFLQKAYLHLDGCGCQKCGVTESKWENEVYEFVHSLCDDTINNDRNILDGKEIDIFVPSKSIGFECDGLRWHNELHKDKNYHLDKTKSCKEKGIRLIHIFEDEWSEKKDIVKSRIRNLLGVTERTVYARKCTIREVPGAEALSFMDENHLQGKVPSKYYYGLYNGDELVSLMSFGLKRKNLGSAVKEGEFELIRFCNRKDTNVVGGASKLLKYFLKNENPREITSYCDLRWSDGSLYEKLGFTLDHVSQPNYFYVVGNRRKNRFNFRKDRLISEGYDASMTEHEIMLSRKIYRIYDCGNFVYKLKNIQ